MALETGAYLDDLVVANPAVGDPIHEADDHLRLIKSILKATFPGLDDAFLDSAGRVLVAHIPNLDANKITSGRLDQERLGAGTPSNSNFLRGDGNWETFASVAFDIHDDITTAATIVDADRLPFSDEGTAGDPMRYTTAANLADYLQAEVELNASRITAGTLGVARIPNLAASKITSGLLDQARLGSGTPSNSNFLRGDGAWETFASVAFDIHDDITTAATIADADRLPFSDEQTAGDPMRYTTASALADYMQAEVELNASRINAGTFSTARIPNLAASKITSGTLDGARLPASRPEIQSLTQAAYDALSPVSTTVYLITS